MLVFWWQQPVRRTGVRRRDVTGSSCAARYRIRYALCNDRHMMVIGHFIGDLGLLSCTEADVAQLL